MRRGIIESRLCLMTAVACIHTNQWLHVAAQGIGTQDARLAGYLVTCLSTPTCTKAASMPLCCAMNEHALGPRESYRGTHTPPNALQACVRDTGQQDTHKVMFPCAGAEAHAWISATTGSEQKCLARRPLRPCECSGRRHGGRARLLKPAHSQYTVSSQSEALCGHLTRARDKGHTVVCGSSMQYNRQQGTWYDVRLHGQVQQEHVVSVPYLTHNHCFDPLGAVRPVHPHPADLGETPLLYQRGGDTQHILVDLPARIDTAQHTRGLVWCGVVWCGVVWGGVGCRVVWCDACVLLLCVGFVCVHARVCLEDEGASCATALNQPLAQTPARHTGRHTEHSKEQR